MKCPMLICIFSLKGATLRKIPFFLSKIMANKLSEKLFYEEMIKSVSHSLFLSNMKCSLDKQSI